MQLDAHPPRMWIFCSLRARLLPLLRHFAVRFRIWNDLDRLMQRSKGAGDAARRTSPQNVDLLQFTREVTSSATALRRQISHLAPSRSFDAAIKGSWRCS